MSLGQPPLRLPATPTGDVPGVYGLGVPFQLSPTQAGLFCNLRGVGVPVIDFELGTDVLVFDRLEAIRETNASILSRNEHDRHPQTGRKIIWVKYPAVGGFVPQKARLPDGRVHPHAGTGFGLIVSVAFPADHSLYSPTETPGVPSRQELQQYRFDGQCFEVVETRVLSPESLLSGWRITNHGLTAAIPDGEDLLWAVAFSAGEPLRGEAPPEPMAAASCGYSTAIGVLRWRYGGAGWVPTDLNPVDGAVGWFEPSLIRLPDGALAITARGTGENAPDLALWHRAVGASVWRQTVRLRSVRSAHTPLSLNRGTDGTPYLAFNPHQPAQRDTAGRMLGPDQMRQSLTLMPVDPATGAIGQPVTVFDCDALFGPSPGRSPWRVDHPIGAVVRLADDRLHSLLAFRVCEKDEVCGSLPPTPQSGCWVEEVRLSPAGPEVPEWGFC